MILVLIADDEPISRRSVARLLRKRGVDTLEAASGNEVISVLLARKDVDALVTDYTMPRGRTELLRRVRMVRPTLPVLLLTGHDVAEFEEDGYDGVLGKPVDEAALFAAISSLVGANRGDHDG